MVRVIDSIRVQVWREWMAARVNREDSFANAHEVFQSQNEETYSKAGADRVQTDRAGCLRHTGVQQGP